ncbi:HNH endonuclease [Vibrio campbellii]|uniref:HNH endonuclease n=1 Tax=Vibrio campbellii TaxID=680 RepID=UPI00249CF1BB|nr:HNH endonuclease signature motif containing protein [Vibrio campbellii]
MLGENCAVCDTAESLEIHHVVPVSKGGTDDETNLLTVCPACHGLLHGVSGNRRWSNQHADLCYESKLETFKKHIEHYKKTGNRFNLSMSPSWLEFDKKEHVYHLNELGERLKKGIELFLRGRRLKDVCDLVGIKTGTFRTLLKNDAAYGIFAYKDLEVLDGFYPELVNKYHKQELTSARPFQRGIESGILLSGCNLKCTCGATIKLSNGPGGARLCCVNKCSTSKYYHLFEEQINTAFTSLTSLHIDEQRYAIIKSGCNLFFDLDSSHFHTNYF